MAFGGGLKPQNEIISDINVTPLVDVMLVLLIIFILTVPVLTQSFTVDLPKEKELNSFTQEDSISITIEKDGSYLWNKEPIDDHSLEKRLNILGSENKSSISLLGDRQVPYERVMNVMSMAQQAGITQIGFVTQQK